MPTDTPDQNRSSSQQPSGGGGAHNGSTRAPEVTSTTTSHPLDDEGGEVGQQGTGRGIKGVRSQQQEQGEHLGQQKDQTGGQAGRDTTESAQRDQSGRGR